MWNRRLAPITDFVPPLHMLWLGVKMWASRSFVFRMFSPLATIVSLVSPLSTLFSSSIFCFVELMFFPLQFIPCTMHLKCLVLYITSVMFLGTAKHFKLPWVHGAHIHFFRPLVNTCHLGKKKSCGHSSLEWKPNTANVSSECSSNNSS